MIVIGCMCTVCFFKQKTAYEMRISDWSSDVCSSDLPEGKPVDPIRVEERQPPGPLLGGPGGTVHLHELGSLLSCAVHCSVLLKETINSVVSTFSISSRCPWNFLWTRALLTSA